MAPAQAVWQNVPCDIPLKVKERLLSFAKEESNEVCGFVLVDETVVPVTNVSSTPAKDFDMDMDEMMKVIHGPVKISAAYHTHPSGKPWPSEKDTQRVKFLYQQGCPWRYLIVTKEGVFEYEHEDRSA
jgi:proteasome lid subunit RPN8/RPN11